LHGQTYNVLEYSHAAMVTSGTATVETALFNLPQVVCYKTAPLTFYIAKLLVNIKYISLVNIILKKLAIVELIQNNLNEKNLQNNLREILTGEKRNNILNDYKEFNHLLGGTGASERVAKLMVDKLMIGK
jgi:lipid-A-disaccharide synthase